MEIKTSDMRYLARTVNGSSAWSKVIITVIDPVVPTSPTTNPSQIPTLYPVADLGIWADTPDRACYLDNGITTQLFSTAQGLALNIDAYDDTARFFRMGIINYRVAIHGFGLMEAG